MVSNNSIFVVTLYFYKLKHLFIYIIIFTSQLVYSQSYKEDENAKTNTDGYYKLAENYKNLSKEEALAFCDKGISFAKNSKEESKKAKLLFLKAQIYDYHEDYNSSYLIYQQVGPMFLKVDDTISAIKCFLNNGVTHYFNGSFDSSINYYNKAEQLLNNKTDATLKAKVYNNLGLTYKAKGNYKLSIINFQKVINLFGHRKTDISIANAYLNIGTLYWEQKNSEMALKYFNKALDVFDSLKKQNDIASVYNNIALIYNSLNDTTLALNYYDKASELYAENNNTKGLAITLSNKAALLDKYGFKKDAELLFLESLELFEDAKYNLGIFTNQLNLSQLYSEFGNQKKALSYALKSLSIRNQNYPLVYTSQAYRILANTYSELGNYKLSNDYFKKYIQIKDSVYTLENSTAIADIQAKYENEKAEAQLEIFEQQIEIQNLELVAKEKRVVFIGIILLLSIILGAVFIRLYLQKRKSYLLLVEQNVKLTEMDLEKEMLCKEYKQNIAEKPTENKVADVIQNNNIDLLNRLIQLMEEEKPYLQEQIQINDIVKLLSTNRNYLSQVINDHFGTNFNNFVNEYRVKEARKMILKSDYQQFTIEAIGQMVGFHSKASFNTAFKKFTGVTPSFFRDNYTKV